VLAGLSARLAAELRTGRCEVERTGTAQQTLRALRRSPPPSLLVMSEMLPGAGDALAAIEADRRLAIRVPVVVVGERTALASALRTRGLAVLGQRGAARRLEKLLHSAETALRQKIAETAHLSRRRTSSANRHVRRSKRLIEKSHRLCARFLGGADGRGEA
jgi:hypothetical protein